MLGLPIPFIPHVGLHNPSCGFFSAGAKHYSGDCSGPVIPFLSTPGKRSRRHSASNGYPGGGGHRHRVSFIRCFPLIYPQWFIDQGLNPDVYFEAAAVIIALILLGRLLENRAKGQTSEAIRKLMGLQAKTARVIREGREYDIPIC